MGCTRLLRVACWVMLAGSVGGVWAQSAAPAAAPSSAVAATPAAVPVTPVPVMPKPRPGPAIRFSVEKPVMGLPVGSS
jgi:hypothetical protein